MSYINALHLNLDGQAEEALTFYHSVFGGTLVAVPYGDVPAGQGPGQDAQIAWGQVEAANGFRIMAYDVQDSLPYDRGRNPFYSALRSEDADEITAAWAGLSDGAEVVVPLGPAVFSPLYGKLTDRFGVTWIVDVMVPWNG